MHVSVIVPIYNEGNNLKTNIKKIYNYFHHKYKFEIIVINDNSSDNSLDIINSLNIKNLKILSNNKNKGKGYSIKKGIEFSSGDIILTTDADLSADIKEFHKLLIKYRTGYEFVVGSRSQKNSKINIKQSMLRMFIGKSFNLIVRIILGLNFKDTQCGFKLYDSKKIKSIIKLCKVNRFCSDVEILFLAKLKNISVYEEGIIWNNQNKSSVNLLTDPINMFIDVIKIRINDYKEK